ncbi:MAG: cobalamin B12-binding domain-containing protein, partial [Clostridia bacterium]|nr:cobalamin B12-binding domain-containing protein [Clostridia bacterium]
MKVVLFGLNGSFSHTNLAIRCLRPHLEKAGFETVLIEQTLKDRTSHVLEKLYAEQADVYGFSCYIWNLKQMLSLSQSLHDLLPASRIVLGGPEVSYATERF